MADEIVSEEWRTIPGYEGYFEASSLGRIRSLPRRVKTCYGAHRTIKGKILSSNPSKTGYCRINSPCGGTQFIHRYVAMAFVSNPKNLPIINHIDGNRSNNVPSNLEWCTQAGNMKHAWATGLAKPHKLTPDLVRQIREHPENDTKTGKLFGVSQVFVTKIRARKAWKDVP